MINSTQQIDSALQGTPEETTRSPVKSNPGKEIPERFIFIHSYLDEAELDVYEFRVLAHVARRVGATYDKDFFASLKKSAKMCGMSVRKMQYCLKVLCEAGFLDKTQREGRTDVYKLKQPKHWVSPEMLETIRQKAKGSKPNSEIGENY